jgi:peptidase YpeB-like protein
MRQGTRWIVAPAAGLMLLIGGIGVASAMNEGDRSATESTTAATVADNHGTRSGLDDPAGDDRGTRSGVDEGAGDDRGTRSGLDDPAGDDRSASSERDGANLSGTPAQRARAAALSAVPGASVREIEHETEAAGAVYHVELIQRDGTKMEVDLDANFHPVKVERSGDDN